MKETQGQGNPKIINQLLKEKLKKWLVIYLEK
jgi:Asp-tRNA(Asn)/Glu-tRNA(Gln) amidotransferase B subunit